MSAKGTGKVGGSICGRWVLTLPSQGHEDLQEAAKYSDT